MHATPTIGPTAYRYVTNVLSEPGMAETAAVVQNAFLRRFSSLSSSLIPSTLALNVTIHHSQFSDQLQYIQYGVDRFHILFADLLYLQPCQLDEPNQFVASDMSESSQVKRACSCSDIAVSFITIGTSPTQLVRSYIHTDIPRDFFDLFAVLLFELSAKDRVGKADGDPNFIWSQEGTISVAVIRRLAAQACT
jgi:hypothetical protein